MRRACFVLGLGLLAACGGEEIATLMDRGSGGYPYDGCYSTADCPRGLVCVNLECVADDGEPPEQEDERTFLSPKPSPGFLWAPSPDADLVAVIDPASLRIRAVPLPPQPVQVEVVPGEDAAVILSRSGRALSRVEEKGGTFSYASVRTPRQYPAFALSPSGRWALLYTPDGQIPDGGAEGIVAVVDAEAIGAGAEPVEIAAGRRHTDVFFREAKGQALVVGQHEVVVIDLANAGQGAAGRVALPDGFTDAAVREVQVAEGGDLVLVRSLAADAIAALDVETLRFDLIPLPGPAHDLDLAPDGTAVVALRESGQIGWFAPRAAAAGGAVNLVEVLLPGPACTAGPCVAPGQVELAPDGAHAAVFTTATDAEAFGWLELATGELGVFGDLGKPVRAVGLSPGGDHAVVLHTAQPGSTVSDPYEREVDRQQGYSVVSLARHAVQLKLTGDAVPSRFLFSAAGDRAAVALLGTSASAVDAVDLATQVAITVPLASAPQDAGPLAAGGAWITQKHPAGRISFVDLGTAAVRTITGFELNARIE